MTPIAAAYSGRPRPDRRVGRRTCTHRGTPSPQPPGLPTPGVLLLLAETPSPAHPPPPVHNFRRFPPLQFTPLSLRRSGTEGAVTPYSAECRGAAAEAAIIADAVRTPPRHRRHRLQCRGLWPHQRRQSGPPYDDLPSILFATAYGPVTLATCPSPPPWPPTALYRPPLPVSLGLAAREAVG